MGTVSRSSMCKIRIIFLALAVGLAGLVGSTDVSFALPKDPIPKTCACACSDPKGGRGEELEHIQNTAGVSCEAYNKRPCSLDGGTRTGETRFCGPEFGPEETKGMLAPSMRPNAPVLQQTPTTPGGMRAPTTGTILRRGIEGEQPAEPTPGAPSSPQQPSETKPQ